MDQVNSTFSLARLVIRDHYYNGQLKYYNGQLKYYNGQLKMSDNWILPGAIPETPHLSGEIAERVLKIMYRVARNARKHLSSVNFDTIFTNGRKSNRVEWHRPP